MSDGRTRLEHVRAFARRAPHEAAAALRDVEPRPPHPCAAFAVMAFTTLVATAGAGFDGRAPIALADVQAFGVVTGTPLTPREVSLVLVMDTAMRDELAVLDAQSKARAHGGSDG